MKFLELVYHLLVPSHGNELGARRTDEPPSNALICREAWETQKGRLEQSQQAYWQIRTSASIVASFAAGGGVAAIVALLVALKDARVAQLGNLGYGALGLSAVSVGLFIFGAWFSLRGAMSREIKEIVDPNALISKPDGYHSEAELLRQMIANARAVITDHQAKTREIAHDLRLGVGALIASIGLSLLLSLALVFSSTMSTDTDKTSIDVNPPMPAEPKPMEGGTTTEGDNSGTFQKGGDQSKVITKEVKKK